MTRIAVCRPKPTTPESIVVHLEELKEIARLSESLGGSAHAAAARDLTAFLKDDNLRVVVFGEFSVGKSTLINALFGRAALPAKAMPTTGHATWIRFGEPECVCVTGTDGVSTFCPLDRLGTFVTLDLHSRAREDIDTIEVFLQSPLLRDGLTLIDTPGVNDAAVQTARAEQAVMGADLVLLVLRANQMLGSEIRQRAADWMAKELGKPVVPVLNGLNQIEDKDRDELRRQLGAWAKATLTPTLGKPFFEVNALGALRHARGTQGAERPVDDFHALRSALEAVVGKHRRYVQRASRTNQTFALLRRVSDWNLQELKQLMESADRLRRRRENQRERLQTMIDGLTRRADREYTHVRALVVASLNGGWKRLASRIAGKGKDELKRKARRWYDTYLDEAIRAADQTINQRLAEIARETDAPAPDVVTLAELVILCRLSDVHVTERDNSNAVSKGCMGGTALGALLGTVIAPGLGTAFGGFLGGLAGSLLVGAATRQEPDYAADYTKAASKDWNTALPEIVKAALEQFKARLNDLLTRLRRQCADLERTRPAGDEIKTRRKLQELLKKASDRLTAAVTQKPRSRTSDF
jgi:hypothetical protein